MPPLLAGWRTRPTLGGGFALREAGAIPCQEVPLKTKPTFEYLEITECNAC